MSYHTKYINFLDDKVQFIKNRMVEKEFLYTEIDKVILQQGTDVVRPKVSIAFGFILILLSYIIYDNAGFDPSGLNRSIIYGLIIMFMFGFLGGYAIWSALPIHQVITITMRDNTRSFELLPIIKESSIEEFNEFLKSRLKSNQIFTNRLVK